MFFRKKKIKEDYDHLFLDQYRALNKIHQQALEEPDYIIKESLLEIVINKYDTLLEYIEMGAKQDKEHFISLRKHAQEELDTVRSINEH